MLTKALENQLRKNAALPDDQKANLKPVVKFFTPDANATWLFTELDKDNVFFGLCDLGMGPGCTELGYVDMAELYSIRGRMGLKVEREYHWQPDRTLAEYAERARHSGRAES